MYTVFYGTDDFSSSVDFASREEAITTAREWVEDGEQGVFIWDADCEVVDF